MHPSLFQHGTSWYLLCKLRRNIFFNPLLASGGESTSALAVVKSCTGAGMIIKFEVSNQTFLKAEYQQQKPRKDFVE